MKDMMQKMFDRGCKALLKQGRLSREFDTGDCRYRDENGNRCAIGHLIKNKYYSPAMENECCSERVILNAVRLSLGMSEPIRIQEFEKRYSEFLAEFQDTYDSIVVDSLFLQDFIINAKMLAKKYKLDTKVLEGENR